MAKAKTSKVRRNTLFSAIISFFSFAYKFALGIYGRSLVLIIASISTLLLFIAKVVFVKNALATRAEKKRAYFIMAVTAIIYSAIFILFVVLKVAGIDITKKNNFEGWLGILFILFVMVMFALSVINLKGAYEKADLVYIGLKEMTFISALTDLVIIEAFLVQVIQYYVDIPGLSILDKYFPLAIGVFMVVMSVRMIIRFKEHDTQS